VFDKTVIRFKKILLKKFFSDLEKAKFKERKTLFLKIIISISQIKSNHHIKNILLSVEWSSSWKSVRIVSSNF